MDEIPVWCSYSSRNSKDNATINRQNCILNLLICHKSYVAKRETEELEKGAEMPARHTVAAHFPAHTRLYKCVSAPIRQISKYIYSCEI